MALAAIASLALGVGANTVIFTVLNGRVLKPRAYADPAAVMVMGPDGRAARLVGY